MEVILVIRSKLRTLCSVFSSRDVFHKTNITTINSSKTFVIIKVLHNHVLIGGPLSLLRSFVFFLHK